MTFEEEIMEEDRCRGGAMRNDGMSLREIRDGSMVVEEIGGIIAVSDAGPLPLLY